jgi:hypothetical protein
MEVCAKHSNVKKKKLSVWISDRSVTFAFQRDQNTENIFHCVPFIVSLPQEIVIEHVSF